MDYPKMLYKGVKPNAYGQLVAEQATIVQDQDEEAQARKAGWHDFEAQPEKGAPEAPKAQGQALATGDSAAVVAADKPAAQPKQAKAPKAAKVGVAADKPAEG